MSVSHTGPPTPLGARVVPRRARELLARRPELASVLGNTGWLVGDRIVRLGVGLIVGVLIARELGPGQFGLLSYATALVTLFGALGTLGLDTIAVRELVQRTTRPGQVLATVFALRLAGGMTAGLLTVLAVALLRPADHEAWRITAVIAAGQLFVAFDAIDFWFQSQLQARYTVAARSAAFLAVSLVRVTLVMRHAPLEAFAWAATTECALAGVALVWAYVAADGGSASRWRVRLSVARSLLRASWPLVLSGLVIAIYMRIDQVMLGAMSGDAVVGTYSVAARLAEVWYFIPSAIASSTLPVLLRSRTSDAEAFTRQSQRLFTTMVLLGYAVAVAITVLARPVVAILYGPAYDGSVAPLMVLAWTGVLVALGVARENWMLAQGLMKLSFATTAWGAVVNVLLNLILIPRYGSMGAAIATLAAQAVAVLFSTLLYRDTRPAFRMQVRALTMGLFKPR